VKLEGIGGTLELTEKLIKEVYSGELDPKTASMIASILNFRLKVTDFQSMESRIIELEIWCADQRAKEALAEERLLSAAPPLEQNDRSAGKEDHPMLPRTPKETQGAMNATPEGTLLERAMRQTGYEKSS